jgi:hypothetical protein
VAVDPLAASRLPELPTAGYATDREKALTDEIMYFIREAERDRGYLLNIVVAGPRKFQKVIKKAWRHLKVDDELVHDVFTYLVMLANPTGNGNPVQELQYLTQMATMSKVERIRHITGMTHG